VDAGGVFKPGTADEIATQEDFNTRKGVERVIRYAFELARKEGRKKVLMSDKSNVMTYAGGLCSASSSWWPPSSRTYSRNTCMWMRSACIWRATRNSLT